MSVLTRKSFTSVVLKADDATGVVEAIVNTTGGEPDRQGDIVMPGAWRKAIAHLNQKAPKVVWHHENGVTSDRFTVAGKVVGLREALPGDPSLPDAIMAAGRGALIAKMQFNLATQVGREVYSNVAGGFTDEWSVGFIPEDAGPNKRGHREIKSAFPLLEISPVLMGASVGTATLSAKAADETSESTDVVSVADTDNGPLPTRADGDIVTTKTSRSNPVEPSTDPGVKVEPAKYLTAEDADGLADKLFARWQEKQTDPSTRPSLGVDLPETPKQSINELAAKGYFSPMAKRNLERAESFNINHYPLGDIDNFSVARFAMAQSFAFNNVMGELAYKKVAPWETAYIEAGMKDKLIDPITKANMGDMVSGQDGGFLAPEQWNQQLYDLLYPSSIASVLPITRQTVPTRVVHWPVLSNNVTVYYVGENAALTASSPQFRQITATMRKQAVLAYLSNELIRDSSPQADNVLRNHAAIEMAVDQDAALLAGNGQNGAPTGLLSMSGLTTSAGPTHLGYTDLVKGIYQVETLNGSTITRVGQTGCTGIAGGPILKKQIASFADTAGRPLWDFSLRNVNISASPTGSGQAPNPGAPLSGFLNVPAWALANNQNTTAGVSPLPSAEGSQRIFFGDWRHLIIAQRMDIEFMASNVAGNTFANDQTAIRLIRRYDVVCPHPEAFFVLTSVNS